MRETSRRSILDPYARRFSGGSQTVDSVDSIGASDATKRRRSDAGRRADDARHTPAPLSDAGFDLLNRMLAYDPAKRITAEDASKHPFFAEFPPAKARRLMPTFPSRAGNVEARRKKNAD